MPSPSAIPSTPKSPFPVSFQTNAIYMNLRTQTQATKTCIFHAKLNFFLRSIFIQQQKIKPGKFSTAPFPGLCPIGRICIYHLVCNHSVAQGFLCFHYLRFLSPKRFLCDPGIWVCKTGYTNQTFTGNKS